jgi:hypothetical protein
MGTMNFVLIRLELYPRQRLGVDDARYGTDLVHNYPGQKFQVFRLDLGDNVVITDQRVELDDFFDLGKLVVYVVLFRRNDVNEDEPDDH